MKVRGWIAGGIVLGLLWTFVRGVDPAPAGVADSYAGRVAAGAAGTLLAGLVVGLPVAALFRRTLPERVDLARGASVLPAATTYVATFLQELVVATLDVTYRVVAPGPPVEPEVIYVPLRVESEFAVTTIANTITLTPGTITLDRDPAHNALYVHAIDGRDLDALVRPIRAWEDAALTVFGEPAAPTDRAPRVLVTGDEVEDEAELWPSFGDERRVEGEEGPASGDVTDERADGDQSGGEHGDE